LIYLYLYLLVRTPHKRDAPRGLPLVLCVAMGRTQGAFEANVAQLARERGLKDTAHYWHFN